jgi:hypothetical protein
LSGSKDQQETLVFFRHLYYLNIPFVNGDPDTGFDIDPEGMQTPQQWKALKEKNIGYIVRSNEFPEPIAVPRDELEKTGDLIPFASAEVQNFQATEWNKTGSASRS